MKAYQIKITEKNTKPPVWWRIIIPAGITFSAFSVVLDDVTQTDGSASFYFSFYREVELFEADEDNPLESRDWQYDAREASSTYIDDYFKPKKRLSYETAFFSASIEIEKEFENADLTGPVIVKTSFSSECEWLNESMRSQYKPVSADRRFYKKKEINRILSETGEFCFSSNPKSDENNIAVSASSRMKEMASMFRKATGMPDPERKKNDAVVIGPKKARENMPLAGFLDYESVSALRKTAKELHIPRYSVMDKSDLCGAVASELLKPDVMRERMKSLTLLELTALEKAIGSGNNIVPENDIDTLIYMGLQKIHYAFVFSDNMVFVPYDVAAVCKKKISESGLKEEIEKLEWIEFILDDVVPPYYGYIPIDKFCRLCARSQEPVIRPDEVMDLYHRIPPENNMSIILDGCVADENMADVKTYRMIKEAHAGKPYDIVPFSELKDLFDNGYPSKNSYYIQLKRFLLKESDRDEYDIIDFLIELHEAIAFGEDFDYILSLFSGNDMVHSSGAEERLIPIIQDVMNHTRTYYNCGYSPSALFRMQKKGKKPSLPRSIIPVSTEAAKLLEQAKPEIEKYGVKVDLNAAAAFASAGKDKKNRKPGKIYPNDPCPCGSGKKYKKCCGR
ncbi:MAG: SEC-C domain-containing protein [Clostridia bacterium]|nr:SEC-C domain-containing protein [Clostridia bacterium]